MALCLSVCLCLPVCHNSEFYRNVGRIELVSGMGASFHPSYTVLKKSGISRNKGTCLRNFVPNSRLTKFCFSISIVETCYRLSSRKVDAHTV